MRHVQARLENFSGHVFFSPDHLFSGRYWSRNPMTSRDPRDPRDPHSRSRRSRVSIHLRKDPFVHPSLSLSLVLFPALLPAPGLSSL